MCQRLITALLILITAVALPPTLRPVEAYPVNSSQEKQSMSGTQAETDVLEAVLRYQFAHQATQQVPYTKVIFISVEKKDPSEALLKRFRDKRWPVKKISQASYQRDTGGIWDKGKKAGGIAYDVGTVRWISEAEAEVEASYYVAMLFGGGCRYRVIREGGKWVVQDCVGQRWEN